MVTPISSTSQTLGSTFYRRQRHVEVLDFLRRHLDSTYIIAFVTIFLVVFITLKTHHLPQPHSHHRVSTVSLQLEEREERPHKFVEPWTPSPTIKPTPQPTPPEEVLKEIVANPSLWKYSPFKSAFINDLPLEKGPFYSQTKQDYMLYRGFFQKTWNGTFVELGAVDGITFSNTKFFQDKMGWSGVLIEPSQDYQSLIKGTTAYGSTRKLGTFHGIRCNNKTTHCFNKAICRNETQVELVVHSDNTVTGVHGMMTDDHMNRFGVNNEKKIRVACGPISSILHSVGLKRVDLFSIDVEGSEEVVLETMDWNQIKVHVVVIESELANSPTGIRGHNRKHEILQTNGFQFLTYHMYDEWWVNPANER